MPDLPDKGRQSSAPLSIEDADRLADSFTPFWEDAGAPATSDLVAPPNRTSHPGAVTVPMPAVAAIRNPVGKQTLLGIAPITIEKPPSAPPPAAPVSAPVALTQPLPAVAPTPITAPPAPITAPPAPITAPPAPITAPPAPIAAPPAPITAPPAPIAAAPAPVAIERPAPSEPIQSSPEVPGYAIAYTPKDPPSTPAVVIAPEAQSSPENPPAERKRREFSQTMPSRVRSAPNASSAPLPPPPSDDFNPYAPKKGKGKVIALALSSALLLLGAIGFRTLRGNNHESTAQAVSQSDVVPKTTAVAAAPTLSPAKPAEITEPIPTPASAAAAEPEAVQAAEVAPKRVSGALAPAKPKVKAKAKAKAESASATTRPVTRAPAPEPSPQPTRPASKGVIVRDAPF